MIQVVRTTDIPLDVRLKRVIVPYTLWTNQLLTTNIDVEFLRDQIDELNRHPPEPEVQFS